MIFVAPYTCGLTQEIVVGIVATDFIFVSW